MLPSGALCHGSRVSTLLSPFVARHLYYFLVPAAFVEGPVVAILCGLAVQIGYLNPVVAFGVLIAGDLVPDIFYYWVGRWAATLPRLRRFATRTRLIRENLPSLEELWRAHPFRTMVAAKLTFTLAPAFVVGAGLSAMSFRRFVQASLAFSLPFFGLLFGIGFAIGSAFGYAPHFLKDAPTYFGVAGALCLCLIVATAYVARRNFPREAAKAKERSNVIET